MMEEARMLAGQGELEKAVQMLDGQSKSPLKQVEALQCFEKSLDNMYMHDYEGCSAGFQKACRTYLFLPFEIFSSAY